MVVHSLQLFVDVFTSSSLYSPLFILFLKVPTPERFSVFIVLDMISCVSMGFVCGSACLSLW